MARTVGPLILLAVLSVPMPMPSHAQITLHYNERPPYLMINRDGELTGLTGSPAIRAFRAANVPFTLELTPSSRQLFKIRNNSGQDCAVGWFKTEERLAFAKFTKPIYRDHPQVALSAANNLKIPDQASVSTVFQRKDLVLLVKQGYSYGKRIDELIARFEPVRVEVSVENLQMLKMILAARADYMFAAPEEIDGVIAASDIDPSKIRKIGFDDMPEGENRYILCSKNVPDETIKKLDSVIK